MSGWPKAKISAFRNELFDFLGNCFINSKETGGNTCLGDNIFGAQNRLLDGIFDGLSEDVHDFKCLKSRQLGISTIARAFSCFWLGIHEGLQGAMIFDTDANKENARRELESMIANLPSRVKFPRVKVSNRYGIILENQSKLQFFAAGTRNGRGGGGLGRSSGLNFVHASEVSSWQNQEGIESLKNSLSKKYPDRLYLWETTARGFNNWHRMWEEAVKDDLNQKAIFIGWWAREDQRLLKGTRQFQRYGTEPPSDSELARIREVKKQYGIDIDIEQLAWFRSQVDPNKELSSGEQEDPLQRQEQPWTEEEAFVLSGSSFFSSEKLTEIANKTTSPDFVGYKYYPGTDFFSTEVERAKAPRDVQLKVWEDPVQDAYYVIAADPAYGHNEKNNHSAIQVLRCYADRIEQVAEFANSSTPTNQFAWVIASLCGWYGCGPNGNWKNQVEVIIELNGPGEAVFNEFRSLKSLVESPYLRKEAKERGLKNIFNNVRSYIFSRADSVNGIGGSWMFKTTLALKVTIMERLRDFMNSGTLVIRSQEILEEMKGVIRNGDSIGSEGLARDDRTYSLAMGVKAWEERLRRTLMAENKTKARDEEMRRITAIDKYEMFTRGQLDAFFKKKQMERYDSMAKARYNAWRYR